MEHGKISTPPVPDADVLTEYLSWVRRTHQGTDYPGALNVVSDTVDALRSQHVTARELRVFAARCTIVLEGGDDEAFLALHEIRDTFAALTRR